MTSVRSWFIPVITLFMVAAVGCANGGGGGGLGASSGHGGSGSGGEGNGGTAANGGNPNGGTSANGGDGGADGGDWLDKVCLLHDCDGDDECAGCPSNRTKCDTTTRYCVACIPGNNTCGAGQKCTDYGNCIPEGATCPVDGMGVPTVTCNNDNDCLPCDTNHQVCDTSTHRCVSCSADNLFACTAQEQCKSGKCISKCPNPCTTDDDCSACGSLAHPGSACNQKTRHCGECSATQPCQDGKVCGPQGMCIKVCGAQGKPKGTCTNDSDCGGCEGDSTKCHTPINGGEGKCGVEAAGCSDLPGHFAVLPDPWGKVTNLCSKDEDCAGQGIDLNAGKLLRDITGLSQIHDATLHYGMNVCASVSVGVMGKTYSCGVCVPCKQDSDCSPIKFDPLIEQAFGPIGGLAARVLLKYAFGDAPHQLNMYCQNVAGDYGVCAPCIDFLHECAVGSTEGDGCNNDYECASGERCNLKTHKCEKYEDTGCNGKDDACNGSDICAWNGSGYCCRAPWQAAPDAGSCFSDAECQQKEPGTVCSWNGKVNTCVKPIPADQCK